MKGTRFILLSKYAPRFLADSTGEIASPTDRVSVGTFFSCCEVPIIRNLVLSSLGFILSWIIHARTAVIHFSMAEKHSASLALQSGLKDT